MMTLKLLRQASPEREDYFIATEKLVSGNPKQSVWVSYTDPSGKFFVGTWSSEAGKWKISYTEEEYCELLEGESIVTDEAGHAVTLKKGDEFVVPRGFTGTWEVVTPTRKKFVIYEPGE